MTSSSEIASGQNGCQENPRSERVKELEWGTQMEALGKKAEALPVEGRGSWQALEAEDARKGMELWVQTWDPMSDVMIKEEGAKPKGP